MNDSSQTKQALVAEISVLKKRLQKFEQESFCKNKQQHGIAGQGLSESEEHYRTLFNYSKDAVLLTRPDGAVLDANPAACEMFGRSLAEIKTVGRNDLVDMTDPRLVTALRQRAEKSVVMAEITMLRANGDRFPAEITSAVFVDADGRQKTSTIIRDVTEKRRAEQDYQTLFRQMLEGFALHEILCDGQGKPVDYRFLTVNPAFERMTGLQAEQIVGRTVLEVLPETELYWIETYGRVALTGEPTFFENYSKALDKYFMVTAFQPMPNQFACIFVDISARKRAEDALWTTNELLSLFIKHSPIYTFIKEVSPIESRTLKASENYLTMIGIPGSEMAGKTMQELFPAEFAAKMTEDDWRVVSRGEILSLDEELNGRSYTTIKFPIQLGEKNFLAGYTIDITERKRTEEELRRREKQLQRILEILPIGLWFADKDGTLLRGNPMGVKIWGAELKVPMSEFGVFKAWRLPSREPVRPEDWSLVKTIREGVTIVDELLEIETFDGKRKTILNYSAPVLDDDGQVDGAIVVNLDISDRRILEDQLLQAQKMESVGRLAGGVAHDFNNMLGVILGYAEFALAQIEEGQPLHPALKGIQQAARRSADLTKQLLAFACKQTVSPKVLDLNETLEGMLKLLRRLIGESIDLAWLPGKKLGLINMDPSQIDQILANLCVNARDAVGDNGKVTIETGTAVFDEAYCARHPDSVPGEYVMLAVKDNGCGMDAGTISHLFEPFFTTKEIGKGTGLGLATVYGIVRQNNGFINVYSEPGQGATFRIYLPRCAAGVGRKTEPETEKPAASGVETILLVEDDPMILKMITMMLERLGYRVLAAATPGEAIRLAKEYAGRIQLLMTDVIMPEMNGRDLAGILMSRDPRLKCLFMSGYTADVIADHGVLNEGTHFIQKPFSLKDMAAKMREALESEAVVDNTTPSE